MSSKYRRKKKYIITGENNNIIIKIGVNDWIAILGEYELAPYLEHRFKIKIIKNKANHIRVGIIPKDYDINASDVYTCGWCFYIYFCSLYSGPPHNYNKKKTDFRMATNEIIIVMNMMNGKLKFIIDNEDKGESSQIFLWINL